MTQLKQTLIITMVTYNDGFLLQRFGLLTSGVFDIGFIHL